MNAAWIMLTVAGLLEVGWAIGMKYTDGFNFRGRPLACAATLSAMVVSMYLLALAVRTIPIGTGYAIWTGIGALGAATLGMILFREPVTAARIGCVLLIVIGIVGLKLTSPTAIAAQVAETSHGEIGFYVGGYGDGIGFATLDRGTGMLGDVKIITPAKGASFLALHPSKPILYAVAEASPGKVCSFAIGDGRSLTAAEQVETNGEGPCHVSVNVAGDVAFSANYGSGSIAAFALSDGKLPSKSSFFDQHVGSSVVAKSQGGPHAHCVVFDKPGKFAIGSDLGTDELIIYRIDGQTVTRHAVTKMKPGTGPRHIAFSADGRFVYVCGEFSNTLETFAWNAGEGTLEHRDSLSTLPAKFEGRNTTAEVAVHPSGRFVYVSNRGHDSIAVFRVDTPSGKATAAGHVLTGGKSPRHFAIEPGGRFLIAANQKSDLLTAFVIDAESGMPSPTGSSVSVKAPSCIVFARL